MKILFICVFFVFFRRISSCSLIVDHLEPSNILRRSYEKDLWNITGELRFCPSFLHVRNLSIINPRLKRLNILNVSFYIETNQLEINLLSRYVGISPLTIEFYFEKQNQKQNYSVKNATDEQRICLTSEFDDEDFFQRCSMIKNHSEFFRYSRTIDVAIKRRQTIIDTLFMSVIIVLVMAGTLCIGCGLEIEQIFENFRRPIPLLVGLFSQIIFLPLLSFGMTKIFRFDKAASLGLISTASSPGGASSNIYTALLAGDIDLSVTMTFFSTVLAFGTFPFWIWVLGRDHIDFHSIEFPWWNMLLSFITLFLPAFFGIFLRRYRPVLAHRIGRFLNPIAIGYLVFLLTFGVYINMFIFYNIDYKSIMSCCFLPWFGFIGGAVFSLLIVRDRKKTIAICIETGIQNTAVSIFFLRLTFPQPEADLALAHPILVSMAIPIPFLVLFIWKSFCSKKKKKLNSSI